MTKKRPMWEEIIRVTASSIVGGPVVTLIDAAMGTEKAIETGTIDNLSEEARRQEVSLHMAELQARVAQEVAIARRIESAEEVEMEEYYEGAGDGAIGIKHGAEGITAGLSGSGRKITKRVYRFKGVRKGSSADDAG